MSKKLFEKYYARLAKEGFFKALLAGLIVGFSVLTAVSAVFWLTGFAHAWIGLIVFAVVTAGFTPLFYYKKFRPSQKEIAMRVDELGLEERLLTMTQLKGDTSYIATRQRADAKRAIGFVNAKLLKFAVSIPLVIATSCLVPIGTGATVMAMLAADGTVSSGKDIIKEATLPDPKFWEVEFVEEGDGMIEGEIFQMVEDGKQITEVVAVPEEGWYLAGWTWELPDADGVMQTYTLEETDTFYIEDFFVTQNLTITAVFAEAQEQQGGGDGEGSEGEEQEGEESDEGEPQESESQESEGEENESEEPSDTPGGDKAGGKYQPNHGVIDGNTDYGDVHENAEQDAMDEIEQSQDISDGEKDIIKDYFDNIKK